MTVCNHITRCKEDVKGNKRDEGDRRSSRMRMKIGKGNEMERERKRHARVREDTRSSMSFVERRRYVPATETLFSRKNLSTPCVAVTISLFTPSPLHVGLFRHPLPSDRRTISAEGASISTQTPNPTTTRPITIEYYRPSLF